MLRSYLAAALRHLARNQLYAWINIAGLAIGFAAAILIALFVWHERSALLTVSVHSILVARAKPVAALRYE